MASERPKITLSNIGNFSFELIKDRPKNQKEYNTPFAIHNHIGNLKVLILPIIKPADIAIVRVQNNNQIENQKILYHSFF